MLTNAAAPHWGFVECLRALPSVGRQRITLSSVEAHLEGISAMPLMLASAPRPRAVFLALVLALWAVHAAPPAVRADVNNTWDWSNDPATGKPKRKLTVVFDASV